MPTSFSSDDSGSDCFSDDDYDDGYIDGYNDGHHEQQGRVNDLENELRLARRSLDDALFYIEQLPSGIDPDPDIDDTSPEDTTAFIGGIVHKILSGKPLRKGTNIDES